MDARNDVTVGDAPVLAPSRAPTGRDTPTIGRGPYVIAGALALALVGCRGEKVATVELAAPGVTAETKYTTTKQVVLWSDWDAVWNDRKNMSFPVVYTVDVWQAGALVGTVTCDTASASEGTCKPGANLGEPYRAQCEIRMKCALPETKPGEVTLRVTAKLGDPAKTGKVTQLNVNVREK